MKKSVCQLWKDGDAAPQSAPQVDKSTRGFSERESSQLSTGPVDILLSTTAINDHAEAMRNETVARLVAERYSFPRWFSPVRPMPDTETAQAARRRLMAADFEALDTNVVEIA